MTLEELITALEAHNPNLVVPRGFTNPHSHRGYYDQLAFEPAGEVTVSALLTDARSAIGATYTGYKGGEFTMTGDTECHIAYYGACGEEIGPTLLRYMLAAASMPDSEAHGGSTGPGDPTLTPESHPAPSGAPEGRTAPRVVPVPDEVLLVALSAWTGTALVDLYDLIEVDTDDHEAMNRTLRAVLPEHERQVREQVARDIEETIDADLPGAYEAGLRRAAAVAKREPRA
ncbi:hypothetical protein [Spirillospora sp. NBC_01491]|uniref:hypothetical protein n=1 Tax=Spirillospora sp. NBC_01491 TaxID=2976007 RepID=UPI002E32B01F|nr:hypothetical protein [Spirillospora sp. NBC_01491]